jgi:HD-like signal output (HDOD) protein
MVFALGGPAGLVELQSSQFDVIVTDMRMPVVDGIALMTSVKRIQPAAVRLVLSGQTDTDTLTKAAFLAHQFLAKPCKPDLIKSMVERSCDLHALLTSTAMRELAGDASMLPATPKVFLDLVRVLGAAGSSIGDAARVVERDPALSIKILQVVNSAFFGLPRRLTSIETAAGYLGATSLRNLALGMEAADSARARSSLSAERFQAYQHNVLLGAMLARTYMKFDRVRADDAFIASLLRDMGWHLQTTCPPETLQLLGAVPSHTALGAYLLGLWGLPNSIVEAVAFHECPDGLPHDTLELADVVHLADCIAGEIAPSPFEGAPPVLRTEHLVRVGVSAAAQEDLRKQAPEMYEKIRSQGT